MVKKDKKGGKKPGFLASIPLTAAFEVLDGGLRFIYDQFMDRYEVEDKIEQAKVDAKKTAEEIKTEAIKTGYAVKKAFFRTIVESIILGSGLIALLIGVVWTISDFGVKPQWILTVYGLLAIVFIVFKMKTEA